MPDHNIDMQFEGEEGHDKVVFDFINKLSNDLDKLILSTIDLWKDQMDHSTLTVCSQAAVIKSLCGFFGAVQSKIENPTVDDALEELKEMLADFSDGLPDEVKKKMEDLGIDGDLTSEKAMENQVNFMKFMRKNVLVQLKLALFEIEEHIDADDMAEVDELLSEAITVHLRNKLKAA